MTNLDDRMTLLLMRREQDWSAGVAGCALCAVTALCAPAARAAVPRVVISTRGCTLRLETGAGEPPRVFPVGVGRTDASGQKTSRGSLHTGPDPANRFFYLPSRREPAFHRGLPFLRLERRAGQVDGQPAHPFSIHGPVTPTLIWGRVSSGCVRMRPDDLQLLYRVAVRHPGMEVRIIDEPDRVGDQTVQVERDARADPRCSEVAVGIRRLERIVTSTPLHGRICGGVDHWYALELKGGDAVSVRLGHGGDLLVELYGIRAISTVAVGRFGFEHLVPVAHRNRGDRYLRVTTARRGEGISRRFLPYTLEVTASAGTSERMGK